MTRGIAATLPPPPDPPELPEAARPRWPPWYAPVALLTALGTILAAGLPILPVILAAGVSESLAAVSLLVLLIVQDAAYIATAVWLAAKRGRPRAWQFGLRPTGFARTVLLAAAACVAVLGFELGYLELVGAEDETEELTEGGGAIAAVAVSLAVVVVAPVMEELFFRAFVYRALRNRLRIWSAALIDGLVFASVHLQYLASPELLVVIFAFGVATCLLYEATGSVFPCIAVHAAFNALSLAGTNAGYVAPVAVGALVLAGCVLVARMLPPAPSPMRT